MLNACTIIACNYLPFARVLADSFFAHHPGASFTVLLIDDEQGRAAADDRRIEWRRLSDLGLDRDEIRRLAAIYDVTELATAVKPLLLRRLLYEGQSEVVYFDPDICIYDSLIEVGALVRQHPIVLTPHTTQPFPRDDYRVDSFTILAAGVFNLGFIAVSQDARPFLDWWWQVTRREALSDVASMMFTDQRSIDYVPCFFDHYILKNPGYNVAYWNLHARELILGGERYRVKEAGADSGFPLRFFHFSGFDIQKPHLLSKYQEDRPRILLSDRPALARICREYAARLREAGADSKPSQSYGWNRLASGLAFTTRMRRLYRKSLLEAENGRGPQPPDPFDESHPDAFVTWLNAPVLDGPPNVSRYLYSIYHDRVDLQIQFPDLYRADDVSHFEDWLWKYCDLKETIPLELMPVRAASGLDSLASAASPPLTAGINVAGYFDAELGIGEAARALTSAVEAAGIPHSTTTYLKTLSRQCHPFTGRASDGSAYDINVLCINADTTRQFARDVGPDFFAGRHTVGYWFWEIEQFPPAFGPAFDVVDEVWVATDFVADAVRTSGRKPVFTIPLAVPVPAYSLDITREQLGLPDRFTFLLIFDFLSIVDRKNPLGLIRAFMQAFGPDEGPLLLLKSINGHLRMNDLEHLRAEAAGRPDIRIVDAYYSAEEKDALLGLSDCYVSLHRSEGLGLTMAEAMALGKPVIATGYSGNLHFMTPENSYLVDYVQAAVPAGCDPYPEGATWADPNLEQAAGFMRKVFEEPAEAARRARRGQADVLGRHNVEVSARAIAKRVEQIHRTRSLLVMPDLSHRPTPAPEASTVESLEALLPQLEEMANLRLSGEGRSLSSLRVALQRLLFRLLRPYAFQQRQLHSQLITGLRQVASAMRREQQAREQLDGRVRQLTRELVASKRELRRLEGELKQREEA
jgi:glycosyltransferase involved in cell wall biosynthesis